MSQHESVVDLELIEAPWNKQVTVQEATWQGGFKTVRLRIKEGRRFTDLELDPVTAAHLGQVLSAWARANPGTGEGA
ncbi:MAG: hypothetical protein H6907_21700 [Hyphomicrobiales bacterium]|nr:hypothetical protein [Hyphomicrobiales bacterium]